MSLEYTHYQPTTPPGVPLQLQIGSAHSRNASNSSIYSNDSSPWSTMTGSTSPTTSPTRHHHGPALLPKIRPQDIVVEPVSAGGPLRHRRVLSNTRNPPGFVPYPSRPPLQRNREDVSERLALASPISPIVTTGHGSYSALSSPVSVNPSQRRKSGRPHPVSVDLWD